LKTICFNVRISGLMKKCRTESYKYDRGKKGSYWRKVLLTRVTLAVVENTSKKKKIRGDTMKSNRVSCPRNPPGQAYPEKGGIRITCNLTNL